MVVEKVLIIGRTQPDWSRREGDLVSCTVGITPRFEWRRLRYARLDQVRDLRIFTWAKIDMVPPRVRHSRDPRPESRELNPRNPNPIEVLYQIRDRAVRKWYVERCVQPSIKHMMRNRRTLGIVKPIDLEFEIRPITARTTRPEPTLLDWFDVDDPTFERQRREYQWKREYASKYIEVKFKFRCGEECEIKGKHNMRVLDIELFQLYRHCSVNHAIEEIIECMSTKIERVHATSDIYLGLGTHRQYPFWRYMVGSVMRFPKGLVAQKPLVME